MNFPCARSPKMVYTGDLAAWKIVIIPPIWPTSPHGKYLVFLTHFPSKKLLWVEKAAHLLHYVSKIAGVLYAFSQAYNM